MAKSQAERLAENSMNDYLDIIDDLYARLVPHRPDCQHTAAELGENIRSGVRDHLVTKEMLDELAASLYSKVQSL